jgi:Flp pilus assembly CpaF family ATPase/pSer/pThr/pTyr-binding forkhead associated (FHA) protein
MLKVTINEKGGGERVLKFDEDLVSIGRSQRNDVILPRDNVSKRHANVEVRDGAVVVTDRGSTNGTFINGRRARTPTIVSGSDRVFISDFILTFELSETTARDEAVTAPPPLPGGGAETPPRSRARAEPVEAEPEPVEAEPEPVEPEPVEPEPVEPEPVEPEPVEPEPVEAEPEPVEAEPEPVEQRRGPEEREIASGVFEQLDKVLELERMEPQAFRDPEFRRKASRTIAEILDAMVDSGQLPQHVEPSSFAERLSSEVLHMGPLDGWLEDDAISEIVVPPRGDVTVLRPRGYATVSDPFSCDRARQLTMRKVMASLRDRQGDSTGAVTGRLESGEQVSVLAAPLVLEGIAVVIHKSPVQVQGGMDALVERGALSAEMARFIGYCVDARQSVLVCDPGLCSHHGLVPAVASMLEPWERLMAVQCDRHPLFDLSAEVYGILPGRRDDGFDMEGTAAGSDVVNVFAAFHPTALIAGGICAADHFRLVHKARSSRAFVLATIDAESDIDGLTRVGGWIAAEHGDAPEFASTEIVMNALDIVICYVRMIDGSARVSGISELVRNKDGTPSLKTIFRFDVHSVSDDGRVHGQFVSTGHVPSFIQSRGGRPRSKRFDTSIFERGR